MQVLRHYATIEKPQDPEYETVIQGPFYDEIVTTTATLGPYRSGDKARWDRGFRPYTNFTAYERIHQMQKGMTRYTTSTGGNNPTVTNKWCESIVKNASLTRGASPHSIEDQDLINRLMTKAFADARSQAFDVGTTVGEMPEVVAMFLQLRGRLLTNVSATVEEYIRRAKKKHGADFFRHITKKGVTGIMNEVSSLWLEYQYGWKPLLGAARDLGKALGRVSVGPPSVVVVGKASETLELENCHWTYATENPAGDGFIPPLEVVQVHTSVARARVAIQVNPVVASFDFNPFVTALELIPLSFVYEWFLNVGDWIRGFDHYTPGTKMSSVVSVKESHLLTLNAQGFLDSRFANEVPLSFGITDRSYQRAVVSSWDPVLEFKLGFSVQRQASLAALIWQLLLKSRV